MRDLHGESHERHLPYVLVELHFGFESERLGRYNGDILAFQELQANTLSLDEVAFREERKFFHVH